MLAHIPRKVRGRMRRSWANPGKSPLSAWLGDEAHFAPGRRSELLEVTYTAAHFPASQDRNASRRHIGEILTTT